MRLPQIFLVSCAIAMSGMSAAIAAPLAEITLADTSIPYRQITAGGVRVVVRNYEPINYESPRSSTFSYEVYVDGDLKTRGQQEVDFMFADISLDNFDPDGVPEVLFHRFTGGAHCCSIYTIYSWQGDRLHRIQTYPLDAAAAGTFEDLDNDGYSEFVSADHRFLYAFSSYASSWPPSIVLSFRNGVLIDVTRQFPERLRSQAFQMYEATRDSSPKAPMLGANGILAGYVAQKILLGEYQAGWDYMLSHFDPTDDRGLSLTAPSGELVATYGDFPEALAAFLLDLEYLTVNGDPNPYLDLSKTIVEQESML